jgi:hypothetical protein
MRLQLQRTVLRDLQVQTGGTDKSFPGTQEPPEVVVKSNCRPTKKQLQAYKKATAGLQKPTAGLHIAERVTCGY